MKSLTVKQLRKDKAHYEELLSQKGQELTTLQNTITRIEGAYIYVTQNLTHMEEKPIFLEGEKVEGAEFVEGK